jgi:hypothetical protein
MRALKVAFHNPESQIPVEEYMNHFDVVISSGDGDE